jgi:hypothetical protein
MPRIRIAMNYAQLVQLYFERTTALQNYWTLYVVIVGGLLAFSSLRKQPAALTTLVVSILFALFAYENLSAILDTNNQRVATLEILKAAPATDEQANAISETRSKLEPTLKPPSSRSENTTHLTSDLLTIVGLWVMELRRRRLVVAAQ